MTSGPVLEARKVSKSFGGLRAVDDVTFGVTGGEILGIVGPNGAGKTTLFDVITGHTRPTSGDVLLDGRSLSGVPVHKRSRLGVARTFQHPTVASSLTVAENMLLAASFRRAGGSGGRAAGEAAVETLEFVGMAGKAGQESGPLGVFDKKRLMLGTALAMNARALLLDEPFGGLTPAEIDDTIGLIRRMRDRGLAVVCIEHVMRALTSLADRVLVMHHGATFFEGTPQEMLADDRVIEVYLGSRHRKGGAS
ncbi:MAG TPA: ABC transporter ATP-binding protein [Streptosporangiaceae bacterium]|nr:ABC transporter ATP-binding protein [Streptosporangiaceae bacterium]